jgi:hypothetical protein
MSNYEIALEYQDLGLFPVPADVYESKCKVQANWVNDPQDVDGWGRLFQIQNGIGIKLGKASGNLMCIDVDTKHDPLGTLSARFLDGLKHMLPDRFDDFYIEKTRRNGLHVFFRKESGAESKSEPARRVDEKGARHALIEMLGEGNMVFTAPTPSYEIVQGEIEEIPVLSDSEYSELLSVCTAFDETDRGAEKCSESDNSNDVENAVGEGGRNNYLTSVAGKYRNSGMGFDEIMALLDVANQKHCDPLLPQGEIEKIARSVTRYEPDPFIDAFHKMEDRGINLKGLLNSDYQERLESMKDIYGKSQQGIPMELLDLPNVGGEIIQWMMDSAPKKNRTLSFVGALALFSGLLERKWAIKGFDTRANLELVALANSGAGKDFSRKVIKNVFQRLGNENRVVDSIRTKEGLEDKLIDDGVLICVLDEADGFLDSLKKESTSDINQRLMDTRLMLFSSANSTYTTRMLSKTKPTRIANPFLTVLSSAIPKCYFESASEKAVTKGFMSRSLTFQAEKSIRNRSPKSANLPEHLFSKVKEFWDVKKESNLIQESTGNIKPVYVPLDDMATELNHSIMDLCDSNCDAASEKNDLIRSTYWSRAHEQSLKLALIRAILRQGPVRGCNVSENDLAWAFALVSAQIEASVNSCFVHIVETDYERVQNRVLEFISKRGGKASHREIYRAIRLKSKEADEVLSSMENQGKVKSCMAKSANGKGVMLYEIL